MDMVVITGSPAFAGDDGSMLSYADNPKSSIPGRVSGADLFQNLGRDCGNVGDELLQLFAGDRPDAELGLLCLGEKVRVLHRGIKGAAKRFDAILGHVR